MKLTLQEQETIILYTNENTEAEIYTCDPKLKRRIAQAVEHHPDLYRIKCQDSNGAVTCVFPKKWLTIWLRGPLSNEEHQRRSERGKSNDMGALLRQPRRK